MTQIDTSQIYIVTCHIQTWIRIYILSCSGLSGRSIFHFWNSTIYTYRLAHLRFICSLLIRSNTFLRSNMSMYSSFVTIRVVHHVYGQSITLPRLRSTIGDLLDCLGLPRELRKQYHLSFACVWLGESVSIQEVSD